MDTCPFGVATQNEANRKKFPGKPEYVENFMRYVAQEVREIMAGLGVSSLEELCGRTDLLTIKEKEGSSRANLLDLSKILAETNPDWKKEGQIQASLLNEKELKSTLDVKELLNFMNEGTGEGSSPFTLKCTDRTVGTLMGSQIQKKFGSSLADESYKIAFEGSAGQSFGAFIPKGLKLTLTGDANDAVGKGLSGGKIVIKPGKSFAGQADKNIIVGNVALFGATSGSAFIAGIAGERFCVRNSGATVVCEGTGDHALEYMTGGTAVILGETGKNVAAGMSGGLAYILDEEHKLYRRINRELVTMYDLDDETTTLLEEKKQGLTSPDVENLKKLLEEHLAQTGSLKAKKILSDWENYIPKFKKIIPNDYLKVVQEISRQKAEGLSKADAELAAFKKITA